MPKFSANLSLLFTEQPLTDRFQAAANAGFNAIEIQFPYSLEAEQINALLQQYNLKLVLFNVDADTLLQGGEGLAAVPEKQLQFQQAVAQAQKYAKVLKPEVINVLPGRCFDKTRKKTYLQTFAKNLRFAADTFADIGVNTVFEAVNTHDMPGFLLNSGKQMLQILDELQHPSLLLQYDIYHMHQMHEDYLTFIEQYHEKIGHIQFADSPGRGEPGSGTINFPALFSLLDDCGYSGWVGAEYNPTDTTLSTLNWFHSLPSNTL
jgi:hydroxypyruvate isomerase